jgi:hypothetical protein
MEETTPPNLGVPSPARTIAAARQFGLAEDEVWEAVDETLASAGDDGTLVESFDALAGALAHRILTNARRTVDARARDACDEG